MSGGRHLHLWVHVGDTQNGIRCKCVGCDRYLTPEQIVAMRVANGADR